MAANVLLEICGGLAGAAFAFQAASAAGRPVSRWQKLLPYR
jgi:hypothetical protein